MQFLLLVSFQKIKRTGAYRGLNLELKERWTTWRLHGGLLQNILLREEESVPFPASVPLFLYVGFPNCSVRTASEYSQCPLTPHYLPLSVPIIPPISYLWPGPGCWIAIPLPLPIPGPDTASQASNVHYTQYSGVQYSLAGHRQWSPASKWRRSQTTRKSEIGTWVLISQIMNPCEFGTGHLLSETFVS